MGTKIVNLVDRRQFARVFHAHDFAVGHQHLIDHARCRRNEVHVVFALETLLHNVHVQQSEEARAEAEAQGLRDFRLKLKRRIVELQLQKRFAQRVVLIGLHRIQTGKHLGLDFLKTGKRRRSRILSVRKRIAHARFLELLDA